MLYAVHQCCIMQYKYFVSSSGVCEDVEMCVCVIADNGVVVTYVRT